MPYVNRPTPKTGLEGKFSFQYTVAVALLDGRVTIESFTDGRRFAPDMEEMLKRIEVRMNPDIPPNFEEMWAVVRVRMRDGREFGVRCDRPRGIWGLPLSREERLTKFRNCASRVLRPERVERCIQLIEGLEGLQDVGELVEAMEPPA
jgi:aconitate decarboxylase